MARRPAENGRARAATRRLLGRFDLETERVAIERERRREVPDRDADVIENSPHRLSSSRNARKQVGTKDTKRIMCVFVSVFVPFRESRGFRHQCPITRWSRSLAAEYGSTSRAAMRSDNRRQFARRQHLPLEVIHEPLRHQLAQAVLARVVRRRAACVAVRMRAKLPRSRSTTSGNALPRRRDGLQNRRPPLAVRVRDAAPGSTRPPTPGARRPPRSALFTTKMSAISMMPALSACTRRPCPAPA